jgi:hypothetical protein
MTVCALSHENVGTSRPVDNERGKGDHRHFGATQRPYGFSSPDQLMVDFTVPETS